jgi:fermentation-respiration switch protein FrsA (DUF1100 family)
VTLPRVERVTFAVAGERVVGELHLPEREGAARAVVVAGPMTSVKEQVTGVYAAALAQRGIAALSIDPRHFGESDGSPRQYEHHGRKVEDLRAGIAMLAARPDVDGARLGLVGVCLGAGYAAWAAVGDPRVRALATVVGYFRDPASMRARDAQSFDAKVEQGVRAREVYERTGDVLTVPAVALEGDAAMQTRDTFDYYATPRGAVAGYRNAFAVMSREHFLPFDVQAAAARLEVPVAMVHSESALSPSWARAFAARAGSRATLSWLESRGHTDFYDDAGLVAAAADIVAAHLTKHL